MGRFLSDDREEIFLKRLALAGDLVDVDVAFDEAPHNGRDFLARGLYAQPGGIRRHRPMRAQSGRCRFQRARASTRSAVFASSSSLTTPSRTICPRWMIATRSQICSTSLSRWLDRKIRLALLGRQPADELADLVHAARVEAVGWLVEDQQVRVAEQRRRQRSAASSRSSSPDTLVLALRQPDLRQQRVDPRRVILIGGACEASRFRRAVRKL